MRQWFVHVLAIYFFRARHTFVGLIETTYKKASLQIMTLFLKTVEPLTQTPFTLTVLKTSLTLSQILKNIFRSTRMQH